MIRFKWTLMLSTRIYWGCKTLFPSYENMSSFSYKGNVAWKQNISNFNVCNFLGQVIHFSRRQGAWIFPEFSRIQVITKKNSFIFKF